MAKHLKTIPILGPMGKSVAIALRGAGRAVRGKKKVKYSFERIDLETPATDLNRPLRQILNVLNYTKTSDKAYNGEDFPAGYHSIDISGFKLAGQRDPKKRLDLAPIDFTGKTVLDIGCNQGGMLFSIADKISHGIGIDFDSRLINAANKISSYRNDQNLDFYVFNLETDNLDLIRDFIPAKKVDVAFLLAVCVWIKNWKEVIDLTSKISKNLLFESNGSKDFQKEQVEYLRTQYSNVQLLSESSQDDQRDKSRKLYFCH
jgi:SAM-dependent methyltransferase